MKTSEPQHKVPSVFLSAVPVLLLIAALYVSVVHFRALGLTSHVPLILASAVAALVAVRLGHSWTDVERGMIHGVSLATQACLILMVVGLLVGSWIQSGIVPAMIYYGLKLLAPSIFLVATCLICAVVALATGSSWSTAATVGIALMGVGEGLGVPRPQVAGAIISGAYFGDKMSPLSDTTNLAPASAGSTLVEHIRHMVYTAGPSLLIALVLFAILGTRSSGDIDTAQVDSILTTLVNSFHISPLLLIPPALVVLSVILRLPALPALVGGWIVGAFLAGAVQRRSLGQVLHVAYSGARAKTGHAMVDGLLSRGGLLSMMPTVALIICALSFGGIMERAGMLGSLAGAVLGLSRGDGGLVLVTLLTCMGMNVLVSDQYMSIVIPGRMYRSAFEERGLEPKNLSRALEDSGTMTSVLIPWNTCGAFMVATLGLKPWTYVPYCFLNLVNPLISAFYGFTGLTMTKKAPAQDEQPPIAPE